ncbi:site-2 protease family protein [Halobacillus sp. A5]|uniref:site-2 protease family protein n=1 Tax=Halobacillus sp. A5 TaxID=2880263 RepID=UPI0020A6502D|nr:site-2 protease family protein [Halobacillus sp. A5]MCP3025804.1 site-2 protease family protein [Halobacillus sp. A5]
MIGIWLLLLFVIAPIGLVIHETGHIIAGFLCGARYSVLSVGAGNSILRIKFQKLHIIVGRIYFLGGYSINVKDPDFSCLQKVWISLAGPFANSIVFLCFMNIKLGYENEVLLFSFFNLYMAVINMIPFKIGKRKSDGYLVLENLRAKRVES